MWKTFFRRRLTEELQDISEQCVKLNKMKKQAEVAVIKEDSHNKSLIESLLKESVSKILWS